LALACEGLSLIALVAVLYVAPREDGFISRVAFLVLAAALIVGFGLAWSWRQPLRAWLVAAVIAPAYLLLVVLFGLDHFRGWFDVAFVVVSLSGVLLAGIGALVGHVALRKRVSDT